MISQTWNKFLISHLNIETKYQAIPFSPTHLSNRTETEKNWGFPGLPLKVFSPNILFMATVVPLFLSELILPKFVLFIIIIWCIAACFHVSYLFYSFIALFCYCICQITVRFCQEKKLTGVVSLKICSVPTFFRLFYVTERCSAVKIIMIVYIHRLKFYHLIMYDIYIIEIMNKPMDLRRHLCLKQTKTFSVHL